MDLFFHISGWDIFLASITLIFFGYIWWRGVRASGFNRRIIFLESLRFFIVLLILLTLFEPEYIQKKKKQDKPQVVVLYDQTSSMKTEDVSQKDGSIKSRSFVVEEILKNKLFSKLDKNFLVHYEGFRGSKKDDFSDLSAVLKNTRSKYKNLQNVILLSDGDWNKGVDPADEALYYGTQKTPIHTLAIGKSKFAKDISIDEVKASSFTLAKESTFINFVISNHFDKQVTTKVFFKNGGDIIVEKEIVLEEQETFEGKFNWKPQNPGSYDLVIQTPILDEEEIVNNNEKKINIQVRDALLSVLLIDGGPRWEYRYLRNALYRDPKVKVSTYLFHDRGMKRAGGKGYISSLPTTIGQWSKYDVVFVGDVGVEGYKSLTLQQAKDLKGLVEKQGSGIVFLPGNYGRQRTFKNTALGELLPVYYDTTKPMGVAFSKTSTIELTDLGENHLLTLLNDKWQSNSALWRKLPGYYWSAAIKGVKAGAQVLGIHSNYKIKDKGAMPLLVVSQAGNGNVLYLGTDNAWKWRKGVEDKYHYRFWGQVVRWMAHKRHIASSDQGRISFTPEKPLIGENIKIETSLFDLSNTPIVGGSVTASFINERGKERIIPLKELPGGWGVYEGFFRTQGSGKHKIKVVETKTQKILTAEFEVLEDTLEKIGQPANFRVMKEIAKLSGGQFIKVDNLDKFTYNLNQIAQNFNEKRVSIVSLWWWIGLLFGLFSLYWIIRKKLGFI